MPKYTTIYPLKPNCPSHEKVEATFTTPQERVKTRIFPNVAIQAACQSPPLTTGIPLNPSNETLAKTVHMGAGSGRNSLLVTGFLVIGYFGGKLTIIGVFFIRLVLNALSHLEQANGFSPLWILSWFFK